MKVDTELVKLILQRNLDDPTAITQVMEDINDELKAQADLEDKPPAVKKQYVMLVADPEGHLKDKDFVGWVIQIPEETNILETVTRLTHGAYEFMQTPKGRRLPVQTIGEACEHVPVRIFKEQQVWVRTKEPVLIITTDNKIPLDSLNRDQGCH